MIYSEKMKLLRRAALYLVFMPSQDKAQHTRNVIWLSWEIRELEAKML